MVTKGAIADGAFKLLRIWGITTNPEPGEQKDAIVILDDYAMQLESDGLMLGYSSPVTYGESDFNDDSGLTDWMAGPLKKLLAVEIMTSYGKELTPTLNKTMEDGLQSLRHALVVVPCAQNPGTLPKGSGNEWAYRDNKFYSEPSDTLDTETDGSISGITLNNNDNTFNN